MPVHDYATALYMTFYTRYAVHDTVTLLLQLDSGTFHRTAMSVFQSEISLGANAGEYNSTSHLSLHAMRYAPRRYVILECIY